MESIVASRRVIISGVRHRRGGGLNGPMPELFLSLPEVFGLLPSSTNAQKTRVVNGGGGDGQLAVGRFKLVWQFPKAANPDSLRADFKVT